MRESKDQTLIGCLLISGIPIFAAGLVLYFMLEGAGALRYLHTHGNSTTLRLAPMALLLCVLGGLVSLAGVVLGLRRAFPNHRKAIRRTLPDVYVVSRMILDRRLQPAFEPEFAETPLHYFVQLREVGLGTEEYECGTEVFARAAEGTRGSAEVQGGWLCAYHPSVAPSVLAD